METSPEEPSLAFWEVLCLARADWPMAHGCTGPLLQEEEDLAWVWAVAGFQCARPSSTQMMRMTTRMRRTLETPAPPSGQPRLCKAGFGACKPILTLPAQRIPLQQMPLDAC